MVMPMLLSQSGLIPIAQMLSEINQIAKFTNVFRHATILFFGAFGQH